MKNPIEAMPIPSENKSEQEEELESRARKIVGEGDYGTAIRELGKIHSLEEGKNLLDMQIERVRDKFESMVDPKDFPTGKKREKLWEMLTVMELFDTKTAEHCVDTYKEAKEKIEKILTYEFADGNFRLMDYIKTEVDLERFYFACLAHDIGKITIPREILNNKTSHEEWDEFLADMADKHELSPETLEKLGISEEEANGKNIVEKAEAKGYRSNQIVPLSKAIGEEEAAELEAKGFSADEPIMAHIRRHEAASAHILEQEGFPVVAKIAGQHHNYFHKSRAFPISSDSLYLSDEIATVVHLADMQEALSSERAYKKGYPVLKTLNILVGEAEREAAGLNQGIAYFWINDEYAKLKAEHGDDWEDRELRYAENIESYLDIVSHSSRIKKWIKNIRRTKDEQGG